jgi:thioredoxin reductase (NADPH)
MADGDPELYDITIIGGGPAGLFGAFYAGLRQMRTKIIDSLDVLGGQLAALYPEKFIYDVPGFPAVLAKTLAHDLVRQAIQYQPTIVLNEQVQRLEHTGDHWRLHSDQSVHTSRTILISAGAGSFTPKRLTGREFEQFEGRGLHYVIKDLEQFKGRSMLVVGGGDSAVDWALNLLRVTDKITLIHRRDQFRAHEDSVAKLHASAVLVRTPYELRRIEGDGHVQRAVIYQSHTSEEEMVEVLGVLVNFGFLSTLGPIRDWGLRLDQGGIAVDTMMRTNLPGVFAAGDVASYPGKLKLIATGFGEAAVAVNHAKVQIDPASSSFPGHSTSLVPKQRKGTA